VWSIISCSVAFWGTALDYNAFGNALGSKDPLVLKWGYIALLAGTVCVLLLAVYSWWTDTRSKLDRELDELEREPDCEVFSPNIDSP